MKSIKLMFVLEETLGWKTYAAQLRKVVETRSDIDSHIVTFKFSKPSLYWLKRSNVSSLQRVYRRRDPISAIRGRMGEGIGRELARFAPDAVHFAAHWPSAAVAWDMEMVPFSVTLDSTRACIERDLRRNAWNSADMDRERALLQRATHIYPMSHWAAESLIKDYAVAAERIKIIPPSIDLTRFRPPSPPATKDRLPRIIFIGTDFVRKGGLRLLRWMAGPLRGLCELHIVSAEATAYGCHPGVVFHGRVENDRLVTELLPNMDIFCEPTVSDMSSYVVAEASAAWLPCIASAVGGIPDLIHDNETGYLLPAQDDAAFISKLRTLIANPELRVQMGQNARAFAEKTVDAQKNLNGLIDDLKILGTPQGRREPRHTT